MKNNQLLLIVFLVVFLLSAIVLSVTVGTASINLFKLHNLIDKQIAGLRVMRTILAFFAGAGLAVCGLILQSALRNPLVEPYCLGVASGAALGAVASINLGLPSNLHPVVAFACALYTIFLVYRLATVDKTVSIVSLLLCGVIISILASSITIFFVYISRNEAIHGILWWLLGNLQVFDTQKLMVVSALVSLGIIASIGTARKLNALSLGEEEAMHLGIDVERFKRLLFVLCSLITAGIVSTCGMIGFVGLIIPHMVRKISGMDHHISIPVAALTGGIFLIVCDTIARIALRSVEIPIGVITALVGAPIFIALFRKQQHND